MSSTTFQAGVAPGLALRARPGLWWGGLLAGLAWLAAGLVTFLLPDEIEVGRTQELGLGAALLGAALLLAAFSAPWLGRAGQRLRLAGPWLTVLGLALAGWELVTAKYALLPLPFFASPQGLLEVYLEDWPRLGESVLRSLWLLLTGYAIGAAAGFVAGVALGWSRAIGYWVHPVLRLVGPLPATAWLPVAFFAFPSSGSASTFLVALATWFPVTVLTWSGVAGVNKAYYDIARTLGASQRFLVLKVAVPAALPQVFVGLFMGLGASFSVLVVAEMLGVKAGLGWYLQWAQGWAAYGNMYAALLVMALMCSTLVTLLFKGRDRVLAWQKGTVRW
ncbi:ABC transporter permease [Pseudoroseomonas cervicalis]|uniref:ABC transporter permease n=1 Tax=Teichococcus cervicalis TaxID=204525 RepID=UPI002789BB0A|nr:ABC transporter permease subunit [Pseudoroseomonas cervicalis]MDQ1077645.1 NitT/TauT family transport system permease protein [Pseudoroseomonas cervicalis]